MTSLRIDSANAKALEARAGLALASVLILLLAAPWILAAETSAGAEPPVKKLMLVGDWPIQRLAVYANAGLLDRELGERCAGKVRWKTVYAGAVGPVTYLFTQPAGHPDMPKPDYILVAYGGLDIWLTPARTDATAFGNNLRKALDMLREKYPDAKIVLGTSIPYASYTALGDAALDRPDGWDALLESNVNAATRALAKELDLPLLDFHRTFKENGADALIGFGFRYPNARGRQVLAQALCDGMARVAVGTAAVPAKPAATAEFGGRRHAQLMLLGDSITAGSLGMPTLTGSMGEALVAACATNIIWDVNNVAAPGEAIPSALARIRELLDRNQPDYVTVSYGLNDMYFTEAKNDPAVFESNLRSLIKAIQEHPSKAQVFLLTCTPLHDAVLKKAGETNPQRKAWDDPMFLKGGPDKVLEAEINPITRRVAKDLGLPLFDIHRAFMAGDLGKLIGGDGVHLQDAGGQLLFDAVQSGIGSFVRARVLKVAADVQAEQEAMTLLKEAGMLKDKDRPKAVEKVLAAAQKCPYLAETWVLLDQLAPPSPTAEKNTE